MKPNILPPLDPIKVGEQIVKKVKANLLKGGQRVADTQVYFHENKLYVTIEHNAGSYFDLMEVVVNHPFVKEYEFEHHPGLYDWASGVYLKDYSAATVIVGY